MNTEFTPTQDDKVMGALANAAILIPMWGLIATIIIWATQREKSEFIRDQTIQALSWQITEIVAIILGMGCYMSSFFLMFATLFASANSSEAPPPGFFFPFCIIGLIILMSLAFILVGIVAAIRNLQGYAFTYPAIGSWVRGYINK